MSAIKALQYTFILGTCLMSLLITAQESAKDDNPSPWSVRLVGGTYRSEGRVEVYVDNQWGTICDSLWSIEEANVVCRTLNYSGADLALVAGQYGGGQGVVLFDNMECTGLESNISACRYSDQVDQTRCDHNRDAAVVCTSQGSLRLADGTVPGEGRVEILGESGEWGTICDDGWDVDDARVACRQLGYPDALEALVNQDRREGTPVFGPGTGPILLDGLFCTDDQRHLRDCGVTKGWGIHDCTHNEDAGMKCDTKLIRLVDGVFGDEGRVEVYYGGHWGRICPTNWSIEDANVACRELGYPLGARSTKMFDGGDNPFLLDDVRCEGNESRLADCVSLGWANNRNCDDGHDGAGVVCNDPMDVAKLLSGSSTLEGVVEYRFRSDPGLICDPDWSDTEANIICRQLGFQEGRTGQPVALGPLSGTIHYHDYQCNGTENQIEDCPYTRQSGGTQCEQEDIAQVVCGPPKDFDLRMTGSAFSEQGALEVFIDDQWGYIADGYFSYSDLDTACRHLGYDRGTRSFSQRHDYFSRSSRPILIDNLSCNEEDTKITDCYELELTGPNSTRDEDDVKSAICVPYENVANHPVRFRDENGVINNDYGVVEIYHDGVWGVICDSHFYQHERLCRQLGHKNLENAGYLSNYDKKFKSSARMWFRLSYCRDTDDMLYQCWHGAWGDDEDCSRDYIATSKCVNIDNSYDYEVTPSSWRGYSLSGWEIVLIIIAVLVPMCCIVACCYRSQRAQTITINGNAPAASASYTAATNATRVDGGSADSSPPYVPPSPTPNESPPTYDSVTKPIDQKDAATNIENQAND